MIQNIKNIIKFAYFNEIRQQNLDTKHFKNFKAKRHQNPQETTYNDLQQLCTLIKSQERCEHWIVLAQNFKEELYNSILEGTITVHNLFLLLIQCRVLPTDVWIPIEALCKLKGDKDNQLCCLIHFTVMNLGQRHKNVFNPPVWTREKAQKQLGPNFERVYGHTQISLQQKIAILPMLIVLNEKNSSVLWSKLKWLDSFPYAIIANLHSNMKRIIEQGVSTTITGTNDYFTTKMCIKSIQLLEVQGFVSVKSLFTFAYQIYNVSLLLSLLASYEPAYDEGHNSFRLQLIEFVVELFGCMELYEYEFDFGKDNKDFTNLKQIIVKNKLYMEQLNDIRFNQQLQNIVLKLDQNSKETKGQLKCYPNDEDNHFGKLESATKNVQAWFFNNFKTFSQISTTRSQNNINIAKIIPRTWSQVWIKDIQGNPLNENNFQYGEDDDQEQSLITPQKPQQKIAKFRAQRQESIITHILNELYHLKTDYLQLLQLMLMDCYQRDEEPWSQVNSSLYRLQLYLIKNHLLEFLIYNFNSIQTKNNPMTMISYYKIIGLMLKANPIAYGKLDKLLIDIEEQMGLSEAEKKRNLRKGNRNQRYDYSSRNIVDCLAQSFLENVGLSKTAILMILSDQFQWKQNELEAYPNSLYDSHFVKKVIGAQKTHWMTQLIESICCIIPITLPIETKKKQTESQKLEKLNQKYEWVTLLLTLYYYYEQTMQIVQKKKRIANQGKNSQKPESHEKISAPNRAFLDKILEDQKFMERLYSRWIEVAYVRNQNGTRKIICQQDRINSQRPDQIVVKQERILNVLTSIMDEWEDFYNKNSKKRIMDYSLSFPMLKTFKKKLRSRITGFLKTKQYEQKGEEFYFNYSKSNRQ